MSLRQDEIAALSNLETAFLYLGVGGAVPLQQDFSKYKSSK